MILVTINVSVILRSELCVSVYELVGSVYVTLLSTIYHDSECFVCEVWVMRFDMFLS
jgi:hypothetical protein